MTQFAANDLANAPCVPMRPQACHRISASVSTVQPTDHLFQPTVPEKTPTCQQNHAVRMTSLQAVRLLTQALQGTRETVTHIQRVRTIRQWLVSPASTQTRRLRKFAHNWIGKET